MSGKRSHKIDKDLTDFFVRLGFQSGWHSEWFASEVVKHVISMTDSQILLKEFKTNMSGSKIHSHFDQGESEDIRKSHRSAIRKVIDKNL